MYRLPSRPPSGLALRASHLCNLNPVSANHMCDCFVWSMQHRPAPASSRQFGMYDTSTPRAKSRAVLRPPWPPSIGTTGRNAHSGRAVARSMNASAMGDGLLFSALWHGLAAGMVGASVSRACIPPATYDRERRRSHSDSATCGWSHRSAETSHAHQRESADSTHAMRRRHHRSAPCHGREQAQCCAAERNLARRRALLCSLFSFPDAPVPCTPSPLHRPRCAVCYVKSSHAV